MTDSISSSTSSIPSTAYSTFNEEGVNISSPSPQLKQDSPFPADVLSADPFLQSKQELERFAPSPPRQEASNEAGAPAKVSVRDLQSQRATRSGQASLKNLAAALSRPDVFDESTFGAGLGTQLNVSFFDRGAQSSGFYKGLSSMLDNPTQTRATLTKALGHLPADARNDAVDKVMNAITDKFCSKVKDLMQARVDEATGAAQAKIAPFCGKNSNARAQLMHKLVNQSSLPEHKLVDELRAVGMTESDAEGLAEDLIDARKDPSMKSAIKQAALTGNFSSEQWSKGFTDGDVCNLNEAFQDAFSNTSKLMGKVGAQLVNDRAKGDAAFTNPLFETAKRDAFKQLGVNLKSDSGTAKAVQQNITSQQTQDNAEGHLCNVVLALSSLLNPAGLVVGLVAGGVSSAPGIAVARNNRQASEGGLIAGTNTQGLVDANNTKESIAYAEGAVNVVLGGVGGKLADPSPIAGTSGIEEIGKALVKENLEGFKTIAKEGAKETLKQSVFPAAGLAVATGANGMRSMVSDGSN